MIGDQRQRLKELFASVEAGAVFDCDHCMPYEDGRTVWVCREPRIPIHELWPQTKSYI